MSLFAGTNLLSIIEPALLAVTWCIFMRRGAYRSFPAFCAYLSCRLGVYAVLSLVILSTHWGLINKHLAYAIYYYVYWVGYLAGAAMAFLVLQAVFSHLIQPYPGLHRVGLIGFRWATAASLLIAVVLAIFPAGLNQNVLIQVTSSTMRCMSILELCLLAFILLTMQTLQLSPRSRDFGIALGLAMIAAAELGGSAFAFGHSTMASIANYASQCVVTLAAAVWAMYFAWPEVQRAALIIPVSSPLMRWDEVASALVEPAPQIAFSSPSSFFLQDVEKAVDKVMERNSKNPAN
jgi:hypothetical protein